MTARPALSIKGRALRYLSQREHSRAELERKLARQLRDEDDAPGGPSAAERVAKALDELAAAGLLDETRAAESMVRAQAARFGNARLRHYLRQKGVPDDESLAAIDRLAADEAERARSVWQRKFGAEPAADARERAKQARFLAGRGFGGDVIHRVLRDAGRSVEDEDLQGPMDGDPSV